MKIIEHDDTISTKELADSMDSFEPGSFLAVYNDVPEFDPHAFVEQINRPDGPLMVVETADGLVGEDREEGRQDISTDFSRSTGFFDLHKDGFAYPQVPPQFLLHAHDAGTLDIPTFFIDTQAIIEQMEPGDVEQLEKLEMVLKKTNGKEYVHPVVMPHSQTGENVLYLTSQRAVIQPMQEHLSAVSARDTARVMNTVFDITDDLTQEHHWHSGQSVVFDNERLLHGRGKPANGESVARDPSRKLTRLWMAPRTQRPIFQR